MAWYVRVGKIGSGGSNTDICGMQILEIYFQKCGYRMGEQLMLHSRRRFRLSPPQAPVPNLPQVDSNLWIVHYGPSEKDQAIPVNMVPMSPQTQQTLNFRQYLFQMGQITRKEFMLSDRVNWPQIPLPGRAQAMYPAAPNARGIPQTMAYPPHSTGATPKRRGTHANQTPGHQPQMMGAVQAMENAYDDDEDTSRGDMFDHLTAREVSMARYQQNHEWMEEVLSSPYRLHQIVAPDLGLGLKGELASLTQGIFEAQGADAMSEPPEKPYTGRLDPNLSKEFRERMEKKTAALTAEVAEMKAKHSQVMAKFKGNATIKYAEHELRYAVQGSGSEAWRLEGRYEEGEDGATGWKPKHDKTLEEIVAGVETSLGKQINRVDDVQRVADGGYLEPVPEPEPVPQVQAPPELLGVAGQPSAMSRQASHAGSQHSGVIVGDSDIDMGGTAAGMLDQMHSGFSSTSTPVNNFPTPQPQLSAIPSNAGTPANMNVLSPQPTQTAPVQVPTAGAAEDVSMEDVNTAKTAPDQGTGSGDWVVVPKGGVSPMSAAGSSAGPAQSLSAPPPLANTPAVAPPAASSKPPSAAPTPGDGLGFDGDNNDFSSLGDLDTAGDALASYDPPSTGGDLGELNMDLEDSAFGDAFHGVDQSGDAGTPAEGGM
jgi:hypothetical protein